jgi:hypothetical protein
MSVCGCVGPHEKSSVTFQPGHQSVFFICSTWQGTLGRSHQQRRDRTTLEWLLLGTKEEWLSQVQLMRIIYYDGCSVHFDLGQEIQVIRVIRCARSIWHLPFISFHLSHPNG